jgi:hypothetical protein
VVRDPGAGESDAQFGGETLPGLVILGTAREEELHLYAEVEGEVTAGHGERCFVYLDGNYAVSQ